MGIFKSIKKAVNSNTPIQTVIAEVPFNSRTKLNNQYRIIFSEYPSKYKVEIYNGNVLQQKRKFNNKDKAIKEFYFFQQALLKSQTAIVK